MGLLSIVVGASWASVGVTTKFVDYSIFTNPVQLGSRVVVSASAPARLVCLEPNAKVAWTIPVPSAKGKQAHVSKIVGNAKTGIYFTWQELGSGGLIRTHLGRVDSMGKLLWHKPGAGLHTLAVSPSGDVVSGTSDYSYARYRPNGSQVWLREFPKKFFKSVIADDDATYIVGEVLKKKDRNLAVTKIDHHGLITWSRDLGHQGGSVLTPTKTGLWLYSEKYVKTPITLRCANLRNGTVLWSRVLSTEDSLITTARLTDRGDAVVTTTTPQSKLSMYRVDRKGDLQWKQEIPGTEMAWSMHLEANGSGYLFRTNNLASKGILNRFDAKGRLLWAAEAPFDLIGRGGFVTRGNRVELFGISEFFPLPTQRYEARVLSIKAK
jgi:outer membrane protein assembly factor BamB